MRKVIFSIYIDIPESKLDNPAGFDWKTGKQETTTKSQMVKDQLAANADYLTKVQTDYARSIGADYYLRGADEEYKAFCTKFQSDISEYDIINFYKHWLMNQYANSYDIVAYIDFDVIPNTTDSIFDAHDPNKFAVAEQNNEAFWGKNCKASEYNTCIRNPASKYWNCHAMLVDSNLDPDNDVFNTAIMVGTQKLIRKLGYFNDFSNTLRLMYALIHDDTSMYPIQIQRIFGYDNETMFSYKQRVNNVPIDYMSDLWHDRLTGAHQPINPDSKLYHVIHKRFDLVRNKLKGFNL